MIFLIFIVKIFFFFFFLPLPTARDYNIIIRARARVLRTDRFGQETLISTKFDFRSLPAPHSRDSLRVFIYLFRPAYRSTDKYLCHPTFTLPSHPIIRHVESHVRCYSDNYIRPTGPPVLAFQFLTSVIPSNTTGPSGRLLFTKGNHNIWSDTASAGTRFFLLPYPCSFPSRAGPYVFRSSFRPNAPSRVPFLLVDGRTSFAYVTHTYRKKLPYVSACDSRDNSNFVLGSSTILKRYRFRRAVRPSISSCVSFPPHTLSTCVSVFYFTGPTIVRITIIDRRRRCYTGQVVYTYI